MVIHEPRSSVSQSLESLDCTCLVRMSQNIALNPIVQRRYCVEYKYTIESSKLHVKFSMLCETCS